MVSHRVMASSRRPLKVCEERVKMYVQRQAPQLTRVLSDRETEEDADPYAFLEGDEEFSFAEKDKMLAERENKRNKVKRERERERERERDVYAVPALQSLRHHTHTQRQSSCRK